MQFKKATMEDADIIMNLYQDAMKEEWCTWHEGYPSLETISGDVARKGLFKVEDNKGEVVAAISIDEDPLVEELRCWSASKRPGAELARLVVRSDYRNQGVARKLLERGMEELRKRGYRSVHFLVSKTNERAIRSYSKLKFDNVGESDLFEEHWWCYEKAL